jgi:hypothetical protein
MAPKKKHPPIEANKLSARKSRMATRKANNKAENNLRHLENLDKAVSVPARVNTTYDPNNPNNARRKGKPKRTSKIVRAMSRGGAGATWHEAAALSGLEPATAYSTAEHLAVARRKGFRGTM